MGKTTKKEAPSLLEKAWSKFNKKDFESALGLFDEMLEEAESADALYGRACSLFRNEEYEEALKDLAKLIRLEPQSAKYLHTRAMLYGADEKFTDAIKDLEKVVSLEPESYEAWCDLGGTYLLQKEYDRAAACYERCIDLEKSCAEAWLGKGLVALEKKEWKKAIEFLNAAIKLDGKNILALLARAEAYFSFNQKKEAQKDIRKLTAIDPGLFKSAPGEGTPDRENDYDDDDNADENTDYESYKLDD